eukprot:gene16109-19167_t
MDTIVLARHHPYLHIVIHTIPRESIGHILLVEAPVESTCFAFDGQTLYTTHRASLAMRYRVNIASELGDSLSPTYIQSLLYQHSLGSAILVKPSKPMLNYLESDDYIPSRYHPGIALLYSANQDTDIYNHLITQDPVLPYGSDITMQTYDSTDPDEEDRVSLLNQIDRST